MITVSEAQALIERTNIQFSARDMSLEKALGKYLATPIRADRDFPPYDRVTMDGIALAFKDWEGGSRSFRVTGQQLAGAVPIAYGGQGSCIEIMTGAVLPEGTDTIIRFEDLDIRGQEGEQYAHITVPELSKGQNVHRQGTDRKAGSELVPQGVLLSAAEIAVAATVGNTQVNVIEPPSIAILSSGDELVNVEDTPQPHQIRRSNSYMLRAALQDLGVYAPMVHLPDNPRLIQDQLAILLKENQVLVLTGGVSKGKADHIPSVLASLGVKKEFHRIKQRPGKPFWFGAHEQENCVVFALPGNPVSSFISFYRYIYPWLQGKMAGKVPVQTYARLASSFSFAPDLTYFLLVDAQVNEAGTYQAHPIPGSGSGDLANLLRCNAFLELPSERSVFDRGEVFPMWRYR
ncbi:MAG: molybdopterin molybdotransferase MoeA [Bacteroidota bacterium]